MRSGLAQIRHPVKRLFHRVDGMRQTRHFACGVFPVHSLARVLVQYGVGGDERSCRSFAVIGLHGYAYGFYHVFDAGAGGAVAGGPFQTLLVTLYSGLVISQGILQNHLVR